MPRPAEAQLDLMFTDCLPSPRQSLQTRAILIVTLLVIAPTTAGALLTLARSEAAMDRAFARDAAALAENTTLLVQNSLRATPQQPDALAALLSRMADDPRVAFLVVQDAHGRVTHQHYNDALAWQAYTDQVPPAHRASALDLNRSLEVDEGDQRKLLVRRHTIVDKSQPADRGQLLGWVEIGMRDPHRQQLRADLLNATLGLIAALCLVAIPLAVWQIRRWVRPLRKMLVATQRLNLGEPFEPVPGDGHDEIALLARSFNTMGRNLSSIRESLVQSNAQLERQVTERTRELQRTNQQLQQQIADKDEFLRAVTHDLGAPLRNIGGLTALLMLKHRDQVGEEVLAKLERIAANVQVENELLTDLLQISRLRARKLRLQVLDLNHMLASLADTLSYDLQERRITLSVAPRLPRLYADRTRMRQIMQNLIDNAIKYMPANAATREIYVGCRQDGGQNVFFVRDTGAGVAEADREAIFQVFRRARYGDSLDVPGRGVGLASVKAMVECHGGRIWVESEPGRGATFCFTLDPKHVQPPEYPPPETVTPPPGIDPDPTVDQPKYA